MGMVVTLKTDSVVWKRNWSELRDRRRQLNKGGRRGSRVGDGGKCTVKRELYDEVKRRSSIDLNANVSFSWKYNNSKKKKIYVWKKFQENNQCHWCTEASTSWRNRGGTVLLPETKNNSKIIINRQKNPKKK